MFRQVPTIARFTLLEAIRTRLPLVVAAALGLLWASSYFVHQISVTESARLQSSFFAAGARLTAVFMLALYITSSLAREFNEKGLELILALDLPRSSYLIGKLTGFMVIGAALALVAALPLVGHVPIEVVAIWALSLALELAIVCAASLFCIVTFSQILPAVILIAGFYLLARTITAMRLMAESSVLGTLAGTRPALNFGVEALSYLLPSLDRFSATQWIAARSVDADVLGPIVVQSAVYVALLFAATLFDFYRREL
jgi:hypothetical protein